MTNKRKHTWRYINWKLWIGTVFIVFILVASFTSDVWIKNDPYFMEYMRVTPNEQGGIDITKRPFPVSEENVLGTDIFGRDLFSRLVIGAKMTFAIVFLLTAGKILVSLPLGLLAGGGNRIVAKLTENWSFVFSGFPPLFAALLIFSIPLVSKVSFWGLWGHILVMVGIIVLMEWARIALTIKGRTEQVMQEPYIDGARTLGRSRAGILYYHVLRVILPDVIVLFVYECARSLMFIGQFAIFGIFFLDTILVENDPYPLTRTSLTPEWGAALGESRTFIFSNPLITFIIAGVIVFSIIALNLIGEGLKQKLTFPLPKKNGVLGTSWMAHRPSWQRVGVSTGIVSILLAVFIILPNFKTTSAISVDNGTLQTRISDLGERVIGSQQTDEAATMIAEQWKEMGLVPMKDELLSDKAFPETREVNDESFVVLKQGETEQKLSIDQTLFSLPNVSIGSGTVTAPTVLLNQKQVNSLIPNTQSGTFDGKILIIPLNDRNQWNVFRNINEFISAAIQADVKGIVFLQDSPYKKLVYDNRDEEKVDLEAIPKDKLRYLPIYYAMDNHAESLQKVDTMTMALRTEVVDVVSRIVEAKLDEEIDSTKRTVIFYSYYDSINVISPLYQEEGDVTAASVADLTQLAGLIQSDDNR
ncbi:MAG: ABC transporter permease subunit, partial [Bacilli bacterium]